MARLSHWYSRLLEALMLLSCLLLLTMTLLIGADVLLRNIGADQQRHRQEQKARQQHQRFEQAAVPVRQSRHAGRAPSMAALIGLGEELLQFCAVLRALADHPRPAGFVGFVVIKRPVGGVELDRLNAGVGLAFGVLGVLLRENR